MAEEEPKEPSRVGRLSAEEIGKLREESVGTLNTLKSISGEIKDTLKNVSEMTGESTEAFKESFSAAKNLGEAMSKVDSETLASKKEQKKFNDLVRKSQQEATALEAKANRLKYEAQNLTKAQAKEAFKVARRMEDGAGALRDQAKAAEKITDEFETLNSKTGWIDKMSDLVSEVPVLGKVFGEFKKASDAARDAASKGQSQMGAIAGLVGSLSMKGMLGLLVKAFFKADNMAVDLANSLDRSKQESIDIAENFTKMAKQGDLTWTTSNELVKSQAILGATLGTNAKHSYDTLAAFSTLTEQMGVASGVASDLQQTIVAMGGDFRQFSEHTLGTAQVMNAIEGSAISQKELFNDIAASSNAAKLSMKAQGNDMSKTAFEARKLGLTLQQQESIQKGLLDFESSIAAELEAEMLLGKELNLDKARLAALNGDQATLTAEIAKNVGTAEEFGKLNYIQQEAIAKVFGMQRGDFADMLVKQEYMNKLKEKGYDDESKAAKAIREKYAEGATYAELVEEFGDNELTTRNANISAQDKMMKMMEKLVDEMLPHVVKLVKRIDGWANKLSAKWKCWGTTIKWVGGIFASLTIIPSLIKIGKLLKGIRKLFGGVGKDMAKTSSKLPKLNKKITQATMKETGKKVYGAAAQNAVRSGSATATATKPGFFARAAKGIGGMAKSVASKAGAVGSAIKSGAGKALDFGKLIKNYIGKNIKSMIPKMIKGSKGAFMGVLKKIPIVGPLMEMAFLGYDLKSISESKGYKSPNDMYSAMGKSIISSGLGMMGGIAAATLISAPAALGIPTTFFAPLAYMGGDMLGRLVGNSIADHVGGPALGKLVADNFFTGKKGSKMDDYIMQDGTLSPIDANDTNVGFKPGGPLEKGLSLANTAIASEIKASNALLSQILLKVRQPIILEMDGNKVGQSLNESERNIQ